jgi:hypothetical protein
VSRHVTRTEHEKLIARAALVGAPLSGPACEHTALTFHDDRSSETTGLMANVEPPSTELLELTRCASGCNPAHTNFVSGRRAC